MRKSLLVMAAALVGASFASAQNLPNGDFEGGWVDCIPWTSKNNTKALGKQPQDWNISNTIGMKMGSNYMGSTIVGKETEGVDGSSAVLLSNVENSYQKSQIVPGYLTLGTPFSTAATALATNKDGGTFGGYAFTYKPDALTFDYKRTLVEGSTEIASVVAYMWKGTYTQAQVPGDISLTQTTKVNMVDRDRNILGIKTATGGAITTSDDAALIARINTGIEGAASEWTKALFPFEYLTDDNPEKINVIIASNDYFGAAGDVVKGNDITIDNIALVYYSRIQELSFNGAPLEGFDSETYSYDLKVVKDDDLSIDAFAYSLLGHSAAVAESGFGVDGDRDYAYIKVSAPGADVDGVAEHTYTFWFEPKPAEPVAAPTFSANDVIIGEEGTAIIELSIDNEIDCNDFQFTLTLPNGDFQITLDEDDEYNVATTSRAKKHAVTVSDKGDGVYTAVVASLSGTTIKAGSGAVVTIEISTTAEPGEYQYTLTDLEVSRVADNGSIERMIPADVNAAITVSGTSGVEVIGNDAVNGVYYDLGGREIANPSRGYYIHSGKVVKVK